MNIEEVRMYCISKEFATESFPFDETTLVCKVGRKMFALINLEGERSINVKCNPEWALELREQYNQIIPGYHMNKKHWNTVYYEEIPQNLVTSLIDHSYELVRKSLTKKELESLTND